MKNILLMTSTIKPTPDTFLLKVVAADVRLSQYRAALDFYLDQLALGVFDCIVYMDNSGYPLDALREQVGARDLTGQVEFTVHSARNQEPLFGSFGFFSTG